MAVIALTASLSACGSHAVRSAARSSARGTVTGIAAACAGPPGVTMRPVTVFAWHDGRIVTTQVVHGKVAGGRYRLSLPPGRYLIGAPRSGTESRLVVLRPSQIVTVNFPSQCY